MHAGFLHQTFPAPLTRIASILPKGEGFSASRFGAIALCVRDFTQASRFHGDTLVIGGTTAEGFNSVRYETPPPARWYENRTRAYANGAAAIIRRDGVELAEIHNRPHLLRLIHEKVSCALTLHLHNDPQEMDETRTPRERLKLLARVQGIYCVSRYIRDRFLEGLPQEAGAKLFVIHNGIAPPDTLYAKDNCILFAGRMTEGKGALLLAQALALALPRLPRWRAVLIGSRRHEAGQPPTEHENHIGAALAPLGTKVTLAGFMSHEETLAAFGRAAIAVVPSVWQEPFGRTALEAMAYGCAVISSGRGGLSEVVGDAAFIPEALDARCLADAIFTLADDSALRRTLQQKAKARAGEFNINVCAARLDDARNHMLSQRPPA